MSFFVVLIFSQNVYQKQLKNLLIIENVFHCITYFTCQILSFIQKFVILTNRPKAELSFFLSAILEPKRGVDNA